MVGARLLSQITTGSYTTAVFVSGKHGALTSRLIYHIHVVLNITENLAFKP